MAKDPGDVIIRRNKKNKASESAASSKTEAGNNDKKTSKAKSLKKQIYSVTAEKQIKIISVLLFLFSFLLLIALISYSPKDEAFTELSFTEVIHLLGGDEEIQVKADNTQNWMGLLGAVISNSLYNNTLGYSIIIIPFLLFFYAKDLFKTNNISSKLVKKTIVYLIFATLFASLFGALRQFDMFSELPREFCGAIGLFTASVSSSIIGSIGAFLLFSALILITVILGTDINIDFVLEKTKFSIKPLRAKFGSIISDIQSKRKEKKAEEAIKAAENEDQDDEEVDDSVDDGNDDPGDTDSQPIDDSSPLIKRMKKSKLASKNSPADPAVKRNNHSGSGNVNNSEEPSEILRRNFKVKINNMDEDYEVYPPVEDPTHSSDKSNINNSNPAGQTDAPDISFKAEDDFGYSGSRNNEDDNAGIIKSEYEKIVKDEEELSGSDEFRPAALADSSGSPEAKPLIVTVKDSNPEEPAKLSTPLGTLIHDKEINYKFPTSELLIQDDGLATVNDEELKMNATILQEKLETFKIYIENLSVTPGPVVTQYEFVPAAGIKISKIEGLADDIAMALKARGIRIIAPVPGKGTVGIEIPNQNPAMVRFSNLVNSKSFNEDKNNLPLALGKTISGEVLTVDLSKMPHLLIAGSTGSGKSVGINTIITSLLYKMHPKNLKFVIIDPKKVELQQYSKLENHFLAASPDLKDLIITNPEDAIIILKSLCAEMDKRYDILAAVGQRNIFDYNKKVLEGKLTDQKNIDHREMPFIVVVIDELADLMLTASKEVEPPIIRLAQLARAVGIHLVVATQRPSVDVITGIIKANFPARNSYLVSSKVDSRTILDMSGAEQLLGNGDMLFLPGGQPKPVRVQNAFISTDEVEDVCQFINDQKGYSEPYMLPSLIETNYTGGIAAEDRDQLFEEAARLVVSLQQGSVSVIQRRLKVGYARAGRIIDELEDAGVVGPYDGSKARIVLLSDESDLDMII